MEDSHSAITLNFKKQSSCSSVLLPHQIFHKTPLKYKINYKCSFITVINEWFSTPYCPEDYMLGKNSPTVCKSFQLSFNEECSNDDLLLQTRVELSDWSVPEEYLECLVYDFAKYSKRLIEDHSVTRHNVFNVKADVMLKTDRIIYESEDSMEGMRQSCEVV